MATDYFTTTTWLDHLTVGAAFEFVLYNVNVNLACMVQVFWNFPKAGGAIGTLRIYSMRFFRAVDGSLHYFIMFWEIVFIVFTLFMIIIEIRNMKLYGIWYFTKPSSFLGLLTCSTSIAITVLYAIFNKEIFTLVRMFQNREDLIGHFRYVISIDTALTNAYGFLLAVVTIKFLHLLRFNPIIFRFMKILTISASKLIYVLLILIYSFFGFGWVMYLLAGEQEFVFKDLYTGMETMFNSVLGEVYMEAVMIIDPFWGPLLYFFFIVFINFICINLLISVIVEALSFANRENMPNEDAEVLTLLFYKLIQFCGLKCRSERL